MNTNKTDTTNLQIGTHIDFNNGLISASNTEIIEVAHKETLSEKMIYIVLINGHKHVVRPSEILKVYE